MLTCPLTYLLRNLGLYLVLVCFVQNFVCKLSNAHNGTLRPYIYFMYHIKKNNFTLEILSLLTIPCFVKFSFYIQLSSELFSVKILIILKSVLIFAWTINLVQTLTLLYCIQKVPGSNLGQDTNYPDLIFHDFTQSSKENAWIVSSVIARFLPYISFPIHCSLSNHWTLHNLSCWLRR